MLDEMPEDEPLREDVAEIQRAGDRARRLTRQLLAFSRRQVLQPSASISTRLVHAARADAAAADRRRHRAAHRRWRRDLRRGDAPTRRQLEQVAREPRRQRARRDADRRPADDRDRERRARRRPTRHARRRAARARTSMLAVSDTGTGMDAGRAARVFEPFFTTKEAGKGTGLGLATVYGIVKQSGGYIWVYSEPGLGTTFKVYLPVDASRTRDAGSRPERAGARAVVQGNGDGAARRGCADDSPARATIMMRAGYTVIEAGDADQAMQLAEPHAHAIDVLLTDLIMPGPERRRPRGTPEASRGHPRALHVRLHRQRDRAERSARRERRFLQKPFTPEELLRKLRTRVDAQSI